MEKLSNWNKLVSSLRYEVKVFFTDYLGIFGKNREKMNKTFNFIG